MRRARRKAVLALGALTLVAAPPAEAQERPPRVRWTTQVAARSTPVAASSGEWARRDGGWFLDAHSVAPPAGITEISASWVTPRFTARRGDVVFVARVAVENEPLPGTYEYSDEVRLCTPGGCLPWMDENADSVPAWIDPATLPFVVSFEHGLTVTWHGAARKQVWAEWRYAQAQRSGSYAHTTIDVAAGPAARGR